MTTTKPACPYPCAGSFCPFTRADAECIACEHRPTLDAHYRALVAWAEALPEDDGKPSTAEIQAINKPHRATRALGIDGLRY